MAVAVLMFAPGALAQDTPKRMEVVARVGPWPVISQMIGYRGRLWFANSVKGVNHNSADLWSLDPKTREVRYERHLFSQDVGDPLIYKGLLYWPYEDTRSTLGWGGIDVTNGEDWRFLPVPSAQIFHIHALAEWEGDLLAVSSAWRMGLQRSRDDGLTWRPLYDHPTPKGRVSRMTAFVTVDRQGIGRLRESDYTRLIRWDGEKVHDVLDWGQGVHFHGLTAHGVAAYLIRTEKIGSTVWTVEGEVVRRFSPPKYGWNVQDMTSDGERLWAATRTETGGELWSSKYGISWTMEASFEGGTPDNVAAADGAVYVGGTGKDGRGILWALMLENQAGAFSGTPPALPPEPSPGENGAELADLGRELDVALKEQENFRNHGRGTLRELVFRIARAGPPPGFLAQRLSAQMPDWQAPVLGGQFHRARARPRPLDPALGHGARQIGSGAGRLSHAALDRACPWLGEIFRPAPDGAVGRHPDRSERRRDGGNADLAARQRAGSALGDGRSGRHALRPHGTTLRLRQGRLARVVVDPVSGRHFPAVENRRPFSLVPANEKAHIAVQQHSSEGCAERR